MATPIEAVSHLELRELGLCESDIALLTVEPAKFRTTKAALALAAIGAWERYVNAVARAEHAAQLDKALPPPAPATPSTRGRL